MGCRDSCDAFLLLAAPAFFPSLTGMTGMTFRGPSIRCRGHQATASGATECKDCLLLLSLLLLPSQIPDFPAHLDDSTPHRGVSIASSADMRPPPPPPQS